MATTTPGCNDGPNLTLTKILIALNELVAAGGGGGGGSSDITGLNGVAPSVDCGTADAGTLRVAQATDCPVTVTGTVSIEDGGGSITVDNPAIATGGYTPGKLISAATTNATLIKASPGTLGFLSASNVNASPRYLKIYNTSAAPTVGTTVPVLVFLIPGNAAGTGTNLAIASAKGINFSTGISFSLNTGVADTDVGAVAANEIVVNYAFI